MKPEPKLDADAAIANAIRQLEWRENANGWPARALRMASRQLREANQDLAWAVDEVNRLRAKIARVEALADKIAAIPEHRDMASRIRAALADPEGATDAEA